MNEEKEQKSWLALIPIIATISFYLLPHSIQNWTLIQFFPQGLAYIGLGIWIRHNENFLKGLGLSWNHVFRGVLWGGATGIVLGTTNTLIILWMMPAVGLDIEFLQGTPHAHIPTLIMVPWFIVAIAMGVELNFRGFLLGRLLTLFQSSNNVLHPRIFQKVTVGLAVVISSLVFSFDPFLVATFKHLHWIAVWDGLIWGGIWVWLRSLYAVMMAHAVEVVIVYLTLKAVLT